MNGGGARAAYQVGLLRCLARHYPDLRLHVLTGVSAGAINAVCLAAHPGGFAAATERLAALWGQLTVDRVFRTDARSLLGHLLRRLPPEHRCGMQPVELLVIRPSRNLSTLASDFEVDLPRFFRHLVRGLGSRETATPDLLSLLMFQGPYLQRLIALGEEDAEADAEGIAALVEG